MSASPIDERRAYEAVGLAHPSDPTEFYPNGLRRPFWDVMRSRARHDNYRGRQARVALRDHAAWLSRRA